MEQFNAVHDGHLDIGKQQLNALRGNQRKCFLTVSCKKKMELIGISLAKHGSDGLSDHRLVVNNQQRNHGFLPFRNQRVCAAEADAG